MPQTKPNLNQPKGPVSKQTFETLQNIGSGVGSSIAKDLIQDGSREFLKQLFNVPEKRVSGNLSAGEVVNMQDMLTGQHETQKKLQKQVALERQMRRDEQRVAEKKQNELRLQLGALTTEVAKLAQSTQGLSKEVQVAAFSAPVEPGIYHVIFFEKLLEFLQSFRQKIDNASYWLASYNKRASKRAHTFWGQVGKSGGKRLLSAEDYSQRAAA